MAMQKKSLTPIVYSTDHGRICPACSRPVADCTCRQQKPAVAGDGIVRVGLEAKGRNGKQVTVISGVPLDQAGLLDLSKELKKKCGG
jgi:translation initiation factor 1